MDIQEIIHQLFVFDSGLREELTSFGNRLAIFAFFVLISLAIGRLLPSLVKFCVRWLTPNKISRGYNRIVEPLWRSQVTAGTLVFVAVSLNILRGYPGLFNFLKFFVYLALAVSLAWLLSRFVRQMLRLYGVSLFKRMSGEAEDFLLVCETISNFTIGFLAAVFFAQSQNLNLLSLLTGVGIGGIAIAFAAKEVLSQIVGSIVLYLDRPFLPGEYVRVNFNIKDEDVYGRIESIGLRSTKIRVAVKNTLVIAPNSLMVSKDVENISRGTKVMVLLYLDFFKILNKSERALVEQVIEESITTLFGVEPGSSNIHLFEPENREGTRARISFFLLSSSRNSLALRKRLVEVAKESISKQLTFHKLAFSMEEPMLYVDAPVPL